MMINNIMPSLNALFEYMNWDKNSFNDNLSSFEFETTISKEDCNLLLSFSFSNIFEFFSHSFSIRFTNSSSEINPLYIDCETVFTELEGALNDVFEIDTHINIYLAISKYKLLNFLFPEDNNMFIFFDSHNMVRCLSSFNNLDILENKIFKQNYKTIFFLINEDILLTNDYISVIGTEHLDTLQNIPYNLTVIQSHVSERLAFKNDNCNWHFDSPTYLIPDFFYFNIDDGQYIENKIVSNYFNKLLTNLCIQFLSNLTISNEENLVSIIYGQNKMTICFNDLDSYDSTEVNYLYKIYSWAYQDSNSDKISIFRNLSTVYLCNEKDIYYSLLKKSQSIYESVLRNFSYYLKKNVEQYFIARENFIKFIEDKSNNVLAEIHNITQDISRTILTTLAFIFAAILSQTQFSTATRYLPILFILYLVANIIFTLCFSRKNVSNIVDDYEKKKESYTELLFDEHYSDEDDKKTSTISKVKNRFNCYWWISLAFHTLLIIASICIFINFNKIVVPLFISPN